MTIQELRDLLFEVRNQEQEITEDNIVELMILWTKMQAIQSKIENLIDEGVSRKFINGWIEEQRKLTNEIRNYTSK